MNNLTRNIFCIIFTAVIIFAVTVMPIKALDANNSGINQLLEQKSKSYSAYTQEIENIMKSLVAEKELSESTATYDLRGSKDIVTTYDISNAYKVYRVKTGLLEHLQQKESFQDMLTDVVQWKIPIVTQKGEKGTVVLLEENGKLSFLAKEIGGSIENEYVTDAQIKSAVQQSQKIEDKIDAMQIAYSYEYYTTFVHLRCGNEDFLIPFSNYAEELGINNGEVYSLAEISKKFNSCFEKSEAVSDDGTIIYGNGPELKNNTDSIIITLIAITFVLILILLAVLLKKKKRTLK